ncbi:MAG: zinc ABC transporter substrate-binding protein [Sulfolobales archaeon]
MEKNKILRVIPFIIFVAIIIEVFYPLHVYGQQERIQVAVTHPILYSLVKILGGDYVDVINVIPPGVDPHEYEPPVDVIRRVGSSDIIYIDTLHHLPLSDRIYSLYSDKAIVLLNEMFARGWMPDKIPGTSVDNVHEFLLDERGMLVAIEIIGETLANIASKKGYLEAQLYIRSNIDPVEKILEEAYNKARSSIALSGINNVALYSPVLYYLVKSLGINVSAILTPDPEVEPQLQELQKLNTAGAKCLLVSSDIEHIDATRLEASIKPLGIEVIDLRVFSYENPWSLPFLPLLASSLISKCILNTNTATYAMPEHSGEGEVTMLPSIMLWMVVGILIGVFLVLITIYRGGRR